MKEEHHLAALNPNGGTIDETGDGKIGCGIQR